MSDVALEAAYQRPEFGLFREDAGLYARLAARLSSHGLKLSDMKIERGGGTFAEAHLFFYLLDYLLTVRVRLDRLEVYCSRLTEDNKKRVVTASLETLDCIRESVGGEYRAYALSMNVHGVLENQSAKAFLRTLVATPPDAAGSVVGNAVAYYFAPVEDRVAASLTLDISATTADGLYVRPQATWDASRVPLAQLADRAEEFVRRTLASFHIEVH
jgi:hypothetical protein